jgi:hypothetical protein
VEEARRVDATDLRSIVEERMRCDCTAIFMIPMRSSSQMRFQGQGVLCKARSRIDEKYRAACIPADKTAR